MVTAKSRRNHGAVTTQRGLPCSAATRVRKAPRERCRRRPRSRVSLLRAAEGRLGERRKKEIVRVGVGEDDKSK